MKAAAENEWIPLTRDGSWGDKPRWSPDGTKIIFFEFARNTSPARIYEVSAGGGSPRELLPNDHSQQLDPNWSPDGSKVLVYGGWGSFIVDPITGVTDSLSYVGGYGSTAWLPAEDATPSSE